MVTIVRQGYGNITDKNSIMFINEDDAYVAPILELQLPCKPVLLVTWGHGQAEMLDHVKVADKDC